MQSLDDHGLLDKRLEELRERDHHFPDRRHPLTSLTEAIVWCEKVHAEALTLEASAKARRPMADVARDEERIVADELERARDSVPDLEAGLRLARAAGPGEVAFDSRVPQQDTIAGALISTLVSSRLATVRTENLGDEAYCYYVTVDWPALDAFAARVGLPPVADMLRR
jgi:hypothetical protein